MQSKDLKTGDVVAWQPHKWSAPAKVVVVSVGDPMPYRYGRSSNAKGVTIGTAPNRTMVVNPREIIRTWADQEKVNAVNKQDAEISEAMKENARRKGLALNETLEKFFSDRGESIARSFDPRRLPTLYPVHVRLLLEAAGYEVPEVELVPIPHLENAEAPQ